MPSMSRCRRRARFLCAGLACVIAWAARAAADTPLILTVSIDGVAQEETIVAEQRDGALWLPVAGLPALAALGHGAPSIALDRVPGLVYRLDPQTQSLAITLPPPPAPKPGRAAVPPAPDITPNGWGAYLNYDATGSAVAGQTGVSAALDLRVFSPRLLGYAGLVVQAGRNYYGARSLLRLDSGVTLPDVGRARRWTAGDFISGGTTGSRPVRLGGLQLTTDFGLRPDLVTFPVPTLPGQAAVPTVADVVTDSALRQGAPAAPGDFTNGAAPVSVAGGSVNVLSRDVLGRERVQTLALATARTLLRPGLSAVSLEAGFVRTGYATVEDRYRAPAMIGTYRLGYADMLTVEGHGEVSRGIVMGSLGATVGVGRAGTAYLSLAASRGQLFGGAGGLQLTAGMEWLAHPLSLSLRYTRGTRGFADIAARYGSGLRRDTLVASLGVNLDTLGNLSAAIVRLGVGWRLEDDPLAWRADGMPAQYRVDPITLISGTASVPVAERFSFIANATRTLGARSFSASAGVLMLLGTRQTAQLGAEARDGNIAGRVAYAAPAVEPGDIGYRVDAATGALDRQSAQVEQIGTRGRAQLAVERVDGAMAARVGAQGALVLLPGGLFRADRIDGSFALVDTEGEAGVPIFRENRSAGKTDGGGHLIVTGLLPYQENRITLDPRELDMAVSIDTPERIVRPREYAGTQVAFGIRRDAATVLRLTDGAGTPIPTGARAVLNDGARLPVGRDGEVYVAGLLPRNRLRVTYGEGRLCEATFAPPPPRDGSGPPPIARCVAVP